MTRTLIFTLGDRLAKARESAGINQQDMARRLRVARQTISNWEHGRTNPPHSAIQLWATITDTDVEDLRGYGNNVVQLRVGEVVNPDDDPPGQGFTHSPWKLRIAA